MTTRGIKPTLVEEVHEALYQALIGGRLEPGSRLKLTDVAQQFGVSAAVVREALSRLSEQGLVTSNPQRGFSVAALSVDDLVDLTRSRVLIETLALRESVRRHDLEWEGRVLATHHRLSQTPLHQPETRQADHLNPAWAQAHREFHYALLDGSGVRRLSAIAQELRACSELYQSWSYGRSRDPDRDIVAEHREIAERTLARDEDGAVAALSRHIQRTTDLLIAHVTPPSHE